MDFKHKMLKINIFRHLGFVLFLPIQQENSLFLEDVLALNQAVWKPLTLTLTLTLTPPLI